MLTSERKKPKRSKIRYAEYYDLQKTLDSLYADSLKGKVFVRLIELISSEENIRMAYRTIKGNTGSSTAGVDKRTISRFFVDELKFACFSSQYSRIEAIARH